jgi:hypothetical protein
MGHTPINFLAILMVRGDNEVSIGSKPCGPALPDFG